MKRSLILFGAFVSLALLPTLALAQAVAATTTSVSLTPLITELFNDFAQPFIVLIVTAIGGLLAALAYKKLGISISLDLQKQAETFAETQAGILLGKVVNAREFNVDVKNPLIAAAAMTAEQQIPNVLRSLGITPASSVAFISDLIAKHLGLKLVNEPDVPTPAGAIPGTNVTPDGATIPMTPPATPA